jgi:ABC-type antimicrobial peptide transport system permease subunit
MNVFLNIKLIARNWWRNKLFFLISLFSLTAGLGCTNLLMTFFIHEYNVEKYNTDRNLIYLLRQDSPMEEGIKVAYSTSDAATQIKEKYAEITDILRVNGMSGNLCKYNGTDIKQFLFISADSTLNQFFPYTTSEGSLEEVLTTPDKVAVNKRFAHQLFGNHSGIGEILEIINKEGQSKSYKVAAILEDRPQSFLHFDLLTGLSDKSWGGPVLLKLQPGASPLALQEKIKKDKIPALVPDSRYYIDPIKELYFNTGKDSRTVGVMKNSSAKTQTKMKVRNVIGHPGRSIVTTIGVAIAAFCILAGLIMSDSLNALLKDGLTSSVKYEYLYRLNSLHEDTPEKGEALFQNYYEVEGSTVQLSAQGIDENSRYFPDQTENGNKLDLDKYYLTSAAAQTYGVKTGEKFTFYNIADLKKHKVTISGVVEDNTHCYLYTSRKNAANLADVSDQAYNCIISKDKLTLDKKLVASETKMTVTADTMENLMGPMKAIIITFEIVGIVLGVFVLYLIINMIVSETSVNISVMKVLGFGRQEISNRVLNINHILVCIGFLLGIPIAYAFVKVGYSDTIENYGMMLSPVLTVKALVIGFVLTWITYDLSLLFQKRKISRIDMVEALKENNRNE